MEAPRAGSGWKERPSNPGKSDPFLEAMHEI